MYIIMAILGFSLLVIVHELGHFIMAKANGIKVEEFSIGMGPEVFSHKGKETQYSLRLLPIGGYVKMMGEEEAVEDERSFSSKSPLRRISVILAGAFMNVVFAILIFALYFSNVGFSKNVVDSVMDNSPAQEVGLQKGDIITKINGVNVRTTDDILLEVQLSKGKSLDLVVNRDGKKLDLNVTPKLDEARGSYLMGFYYERVTNPTIGESLKYTYNYTISMVKQTYKSLQLLVTGKLNLKTDVGGPVTIIRMSGEAAKSGIQTLAYFLGVISINLAVFNLLPFPALDGGWAIILFIELITRRKVPDKVVGAINYVGFMILMGTVVNNGIVFVDYANKLRIGGVEKRAALVGTGKTRMRPILMTALTTILSMSVMVFSQDAGNAMQQGMAIVVCFGLIYSTFMTLYIVPIMYDILYRKQPKDIDTGSDDMDDIPDEAQDYLTDGE